MSAPTLEEAPIARAADRRVRRDPAQTSLVMARWAKIRGERPPQGITASWYIGLAVIAILAARRPDAFTNPQFWAEDGTVFFLGADLLGWKSLFEPYAGYWHGLNRLVAYAVSHVDPTWAPSAYLLASLGCTVITAMRFLSPRLDLPGRPLFALSLVLLPHTGEVFLNLTNSQWWTALWLVQLALMRPPQTSRDYTSDLAVVFIAGLSGPFCLLLWPLFAWRYWRTRNRASGTLFAALSITALVQAWLLVQSTRRPGEAEWSLVAAILVTVRRTMGALLFGAHAATIAATALAAAALAVLVFQLRRRPLDRQRRTQLVLTFVFVALLLPVWVVVRIDRLDTSDLVSGDRYFFIPKLALVWMALLEASRPTRMGLVATVALTLGFAVNVPTLRWPSAADRDWGRYVPALRAGRPVAIPINPNWTIEHPGRPRR